MKNPYILTTFLEIIVHSEAIILELNALLFTCIGINHPVNPFPSMSEVPPNPACLIYISRYPVMPDLFYPIRIGIHTSKLFCL